MHGYKIDDVDYWENDAFLVTPEGKRIYFQFGGNHPTVGDALEFLLSEGTINITINE